MPLFLARGHKVQLPSVLSLSTTDNLPTKSLVSCYATNRASLVNFALFCSTYYRFVPAVASLSRAYSYGRNAAHLLTRSSPKPAHTLMQETVYSPFGATTLFFSQNSKPFASILLAMLSLVHMPSLGVHAPS